MNLHKRIFCIFSVLILLFSGLPTIAFAEEATLSSWPDEPEVKAPGAVIMEASTGALIYEKNAFDRFYPASTTKLMTALLAIEQCPLSDVVTCSYEAIHSIGWDSSRIGLDVGEKLTMEEALYGILLASANEACYAVAEHIGGLPENFVKMMNKRATELGCLNTNFMNPHGLDDPEHYSCPYDLALIAKKAIEYTTFRRISGSYYHEIPATNLNVARAIGNTHQIIRRKIKYDGVFAGKTGHTTLAGASLVTCAERNGLTLICVVMNEAVSDDVYTDTMALLDYAFDNFELFDLSTSGINTKNAFPILFDDDEAVVADVSSPLTISETTLILPKNAQFKNVTRQASLTTSDNFLKGENVIGLVDYYYSGHFVGSASIIYNSPVDVSLGQEPENIVSPITDSFQEDAVDTSTTDHSNALLNRLVGLFGGSEITLLIYITIISLLALILAGYFIFRPKRGRNSKYSRNKKRGYR